MSRDDKRAEAVALRRKGRSLSEVSEATGVPRATVQRWLRGVHPAQSDGPPSEVKVPARVADRADWLRAGLAKAESKALEETGQVAAAWARHALQLRDALDEETARRKREAEAAGQAEVSAVDLARRILQQLRALARVVPRADAMRIHTELGQVLGVTDTPDEGE